MKTKLVSILVPVYNGADRIAKAVESIIGQSYHDWELLVVDDGSSDNTKEIVENLARSDDRIKYIRNNKNLGIQKTLNIGLKESRGEYIARIDDDDVWIDLDKLKKQVEFLENTDYVLVGTGVIVQDEKGEELFRYLPHGSDKKIRERMLLKNCFAHSSVLFRKDTALRFGGYSEDLNVRHIEDYDLWLKLGTIGKLFNIDTYSIIFTQRSEAISARNRVAQAKRSLSEIKKFRKQYPAFIQGCLVNLIKLLFSLIQKVIPLNQKILSKVKSIYKGS